jgi:hypothetical protein
VFSPKWKRWFVKRASTNAHIHSAALEAVSGWGYAGWLWRVVLGVSGGICNILQTNFYEKALFVKPTWRLSRSWSSAAAGALRAMLLSALSL